MILFNITVGIKMAWVEKTFERVPNRKRKAGGSYEDSELKEERDDVIKDYETLAKRLQYEKPSYIELTDRVAKRIAKDILYHETIMEHFMDQPAYKFIMNVASFTNDDVSKFWSDHIKTNKPAPYELGNDIREMAVRIARERADQDVHQWCKLIRVTKSSEYDTESKSDDETKEERANRSGILPKTSGIPGTPSGSRSSRRGVPTKIISIRSFSLGGVTKTPSPKGLTAASPIRPVKRSPLKVKTPQKEIDKLLGMGYEKLFDQQKIDKLNTEGINIDFQEIRSEDDFLLWMRTKYSYIASDDIKKSIDGWKNYDVDEKYKKYYYDCEGLRFTRAPSLNNRYRVPNSKEFCHEDPCGYEYIDLVQPYYKRRFDFHIHDYLKNHYEEKMAYEIQKWYNSSPESIKKIFFAPVIYGHMNEVTFALTHRYPKFKNCEAVDFYHSDKHRLLFSKCVALAVRGSQVLSGKKYGLDKSFMRINLEKRRAMHAWKHMERPKKASRPGRHDEILSAFMARE
jgi:hypothetical protein